MNVKDADRSVVAKPVASRPSCSTYRSFSDLLSGAINASPSETAILPAIRPKMVRFKPTFIPSIVGSISSQGPPDHSNLSDVKPVSMVYKPLAKVVSKTTVSLLASMGNFSNISVKQTQPPAEHKAQLTPSTQSIDASKRHHSRDDDEAKPAPSIGNSERASFDGYNWRKYGQKQVKGSEYPRSYYKCTHPSCPVKKKVERSLEGHIAEIVYKGEHNHSKPQPAKRSSSSSAVPESANNEGAAYSSYNQNDPDYTYPTVKAATQPSDSAPTPAAHDSEFINNTFTEPEEVSRGVKAEEDEPRSAKRRKTEKQPNAAGVAREGRQDSKVVVQNSSDPEVSSDGFRWRKYGQKVVKGNPYPRSYFRCTSHKCNVRKHVERASDDPKAFITTYEGKHNHDMPVRNPNPLSLSSHTDNTSTT